MCNRKYSSTSDRKRWDLACKSLWPRNIVYFQQIRCLPPNTLLNSLLLLSSCSSPTLQTKSPGNPSLTCRSYSMRMWPWHILLCIFIYATAGLQRDHKITETTFCDWADYSCQIFSSKLQIFHNFSSWHVMSYVTISQTCVSHFKLFFFLGQ